MAQSTWIASITNSTLNASQSTYSFQNALNLYGVYAYESYSYQYYSESDPPYLFQNGCTQPDGTQDCTASCQDRNAVFGSLDTLHNCMVYSTVADLYARSNLSNPTLPEYYNIQKAKVNSPVFINITATIKNCLMDYCAATSGCTEGLKEYDRQYTESSPSNITSNFYIYNHNESYHVNPTFDICEYVPRSLNPDIGGIGVYVSYWIQTGLALISFMLVVWWNWAIYYICFGALLVPRGYRNAGKIARRIRNTSRNKHLPSLTGALAEFQKAQCFFMLAINIAALINRNRGGFQPNNLQTLYNTYVLIKSISISGYLPVTFTLFTLHLVDVVSWYLLVLSIITVIVSTATLFAVGSFNPSQDDLNYLSQQALIGGPASCGTQNLAVYCYRPVNGGGYYDSTDPANGAYSMLAFCLVVLILLVAHQYHAFQDPSTGKAKPWLLKIFTAFYRNYELSDFFRKYKVTLRNVQIVLALVSLALNSYAINAYLSNNGEVSSYDYYSYGPFSYGSVDPFAYIAFASCWTLSFNLYLFLTSDTTYTRSEKSVGRFFSTKFALAVHCLSAIFWFAGFIVLTQLSQTCNSEEGGICGIVITSTLAGVGLCITFVATTFLVARHVLGTRNDPSEKYPAKKRHWILRGLKRKIAWKQTSRKLPSWTKHPLIIATYTSFHDNSLVTIKVHARRAYHEVKAHASGLEWTSTMTSTLLFSIYLIFFGLYINWFAIFMQDLQWFAYNGVDSSSWSFGQIVAISVWASPLCEYFHLELRGMTRGFEHRLWGYTVVRIKKLDVERGIVSNHSPSSAPPPPSPAVSLDGRDSSEYGKLGVVDSSVDVDGGPILEPELSDLKKKKGDGYREPEGRNSTVKFVQGCRDGSEEIEEREGVDEWQIPETVILTSGSIAPF